MIETVINTKNIPAPYKRRRYYYPEEVQQHNTANDCWVTIFNEVYDLTSLIQKNYGKLVEPLIKAAGNDISNWFDPVSRDPKECNVDGSCYSCYFTPNGRYLHIPPSYPDAEWNYDYEVPWWKDKSLVIGKLTTKPRKIRLINTLTNQSDVITVCREETINEILDRYKEINLHAESYTWKRLQRPIDMEKNLSDNEIQDETDEYIKLNIDPDYYIPAIHLYFNDDLTEA